MAPWYAGNFFVVGPFETPGFRFETAKRKPVWVLVNNASLTTSLHGKLTLVHPYGMFIVLIVFIMFKVSIQGSELTFFASFSQGKYLNKSTCPYHFDLPQKVI